MNARSLLRLGLCCGLGLALAGCELVADFDRSKIPSSTDGSAPDADIEPMMPIDAAMDAAVTDDAGPMSLDASMMQDTGMEPDPSDEDAGL